MTECLPFSTPDLTAAINNTTDDYYDSSESNEATNNTDANGSYDDTTKSMRTSTTSFSDAFASFERRTGTTKYWNRPTEPPTQTIPQLFLNELTDLLLSFVLGGEEKCLAQIVERQYRVATDVLDVLDRCPSKEDQSFSSAEEYITRGALKIVEQVNQLKRLCNIHKIGLLCLPLALVSLAFLIFENVIIMHHLFWSDIKQLSQCKRNTVITLFTLTLQISGDVGVCLYSSISKLKAFG